MHPKTDAVRFSAQCAKATSFSELVTFARRELDAFGTEVEIVCGPITTGGRGSIEKNLAVFNATIARLLRKERPLFNQMSYEDALFRLKAERKTRSSLNPVMNEFYDPLFETRRFTRAWFLPGWKSSEGASWERRACLYLGINTVDLTKGWVDDALRKAS